METAQLRTHLKEQPFRPFTMHLVDGRTFRVPHPDWVYIAPTMRHTAIVASKEDRAFVTLDTIMVSRITFDPEHPNGNGNGRAPRRKK